MIYTTPDFSIYFGDATNQLYPHEYLAYSDNIPLVAKKPYTSICEKLNIQNLTFCHQIHSIVGYTAQLCPTLYPRPFTYSGDYLVTSQPIALGVMTADCLPIALCDTQKGVYSMVHAGWRGTAAGVISEAIMRMEREFESQRANIQVFLGPAAGVCCYEVTSEFKKHFQQYDWCDELFTVRAGCLYFNLSIGAIRMLQSLGIDKSAIVLNYNKCTICDVRYCSYRRDKECAGRQMTILVPHM